MRIAAIFLEDQDLETGGQTINLGGNYSYQVKLKDSTLEISRSDRQNFIEHFFDDTGTIVNISAIVGGNGSGKTSLVKEMAKYIDSNYPRSGSLILEDNTKISKLYDFNYGGITRFKADPKKFEKCPSPLNLRSIYYSPYTDHKTAVAGIDLSADRYIREDLQNIESTFDRNERVDIQERLKRKDDKRFINFQKSDSSSTIASEFGLFQDDFYTIVFTRHKISASDSGVEFEETPDDFRSYLNNLYIQIRDEYKSLNRNVNNESERYNLNKSQFKNFLLMDIFCLLITLMEYNNNFLREGHFRNGKEASKVIQNPKISALDKLYYWLDNNYYDGEIKNRLPSQEVKNIIGYLYNLVDGFSSLERDQVQLNWSRKSLFVSETELIEILSLNEALMKALPRYLKNPSDDFGYLNESISPIQQFANFAFSRRQLSSGETALLRLYSRLSDFFDRQKVKSTSHKEHFIFFLDEADLGYHPQWKKKYIKSVIDFCSPFFESMNATVQIVLCTHDPLSLSDIPNTNITYLQKFNEEIIILKNDSPDRPTSSFASNVNDLLSHSFFLQDLLIGDFAKSKIDDVISWINKNKNREFNRREYNKMKQIISLIEEPVLRNKLIEMLSEIDVDEEFIQEMITKETEFLRNILRRNK